VVDVESQPGRGTKFRISLPVEEEKAETAEKAKERIHLAPGGRETIVVVEDEKSMREILVKTLQRKGTASSRQARAKKHWDSSWNGRSSGSYLVTVRFFGSINLLMKMMGISCPSTALFVQTPRRSGGEVRAE